LIAGVVLVFLGVICAHSLIVFGNTI
jgi:hypothetical protein